MVGGDRVDDATLRETAERVGELAQSMGDTEALRVLDQHPAPLLLMRGVSEIAYCNTAFCDLVGYTREELLALDAMNIIVSNDRADARATQRALSRGEAVPGPYRVSLARKDGEAVEVLATARVFKVRNKVFGRLVRVHITA